MSGFKPIELKVGDEVGMSPSGMGIGLHWIGTVKFERRNHTQILRFKRNTGRQFGGDDWHPAHLESVKEANKANEAIRPVIKRAQTLRVLKVKTENADYDTFTQRQLDAAITVLDTRYADELPPKQQNPHPFEVMAEISDEVLVKVKGHAGVYIGRYIHYTGEWRVNNFGGDEPPVIEWWPMPGGEV